MDEDFYYYEFIGMKLNRVAIYISVDNVWSSDMEDMHETLADVDVNDSDFSFNFITSDEFEEVYSNITNYYPNRLMAKWCPSSAA